MIPAISGALSALGPQASVGSLGSAAANGVTPATAGLTTATSAAGATSSSFGTQLSSALNSLDKTQQSATAAAQGLATGTLSDPTQAVTAVENASMAMDLAAQVRDKLVSAENTIFSTQV